jgi:hypothetical protein
MAEALSKNNLLKASGSAREQGASEGEKCGGKPMQNEPILASRAVSSWIGLPMGPADSLSWKTEIEKAKEAVLRQERLIWHLQLGIETPLFPLEEEPYFQALALGLEQFSKEVWPSFEKETQSLVLYRGSADFSRHFRWTERQKTAFQNSAKEDPHFSEAVFCAESFALYFQMLAHRLPDEAPILLLFDLSSFRTPSEALLRVSKRRFEHFRVGFRGMDLPLDGYNWEGCIRKIPATVGLVFPERSEPALLRKFDRLLEEYRGAKILFESFLTEEWEGLDKIIFLEEGCGPLALRKLKGFAAAGGEVIGAEGFEPPTYWSQTSRASQTALYPEK